MLLNCIKLIIILVYFSIVLSGCHKSTPDSEESSTHGQQSNKEQLILDSSVVLDTKLLSLSSNLSNNALKDARRQVEWLLNTLPSYHNYDVMDQEFPNKVALWTRYWEEVDNLYNDHPVNWDLEAIAKIVSTTPIIFQDIKLATLLLHQRFKAPGFFRVATDLNKIEIKWTQLNSLLMIKILKQEKIEGRKFPKVADYELIPIIDFTFSDWQKDLESGESVLTRIAATEEEEERIFSDTKGKFARLKDDFIPFWKQLAKIGLQENPEKTNEMLIALKQITDRYVEARLNLGKFLKQTGEFSFEYTLLISWGMNDLFCRSVYLALLTDNRAFMDIAVNILELHIESSKVVIDFLISLTK